MFDLKLDLQKEAERFRIRFLSLFHKRLINEFDQDKDWADKMVSTIASELFENLHQLKNESDTLEGKNLHSFTFKKMNATEFRWFEIC